MNTYFKELFDYNYHCNQALISTMLEQKKRISEKSFSTLSHILNVHHIWNCRIGESALLYNPWDLRCPGGFRNDNRGNYLESLFLIDIHEMDDNVTFTTFKGGRFTNSVKDILFQIINHSTYHRGQIALEFRAACLEPLITEYIFYKMNDNKFVDEKRNATSAVNSSEGMIVE